MNLALVGYGRMGKLIEELAPEYGFAVTLKLDEFNNTSFEGMTPENFRGVDVAVEFSIPPAAPENAVRLAALGIHSVIGTTGWMSELPRVEAAVRQHNTGLVWSPNFSVGVNVFRRLVAQAALLMASEDGYGAWAWEIHHSAKKDAPSGTLHMLLDEMQRAGYTRPVDAAASRAGAHPGTHEIGFDSAADTITLRHVARGREGFARGALRAARWIAGRQGVFEFSEILFPQGGSSHV